MSIQKALNAYNREQYGAHLTPDLFRNLYLRRPVTLDGGPQDEVEIRKYRNNRDDPSDLSARRLALRATCRILDQDADNELSAVRSHLRRWCQRNGAVGAQVWSWVQQGRLSNVLTGKGYPKDCSFLLSLLIVTGRLASLYPRDSLQAGLQSYCMKFVGLDCSGFVNNYFIAKLRYRDDVRSRRIPIRSYAVPDRRLASLPSEPRDLCLVWEDMGHIAVIQGWKAEPDRLQVVESAAGFCGLYSSVYRIIAAPSPSQQSRIWRVQREEGGSRTSNVYIVLPLPPH